jgi:signal transduction histidine kinase
LKTVARTELRRNYLRKLDQQNYLATGIVIVIIVASVFWLLFHFGGNKAVMLYSDLMYGVSSLLGACFAFITAYRAQRGPLRLASPHRVAWLLIGIGLLCDGLGGFIFAYLEQAGIHNPEPSLSDIGFTLFYPFVFCGLLCIPTTLRFRARTGLDALILTLCVLGLSWFFAIGPTYVALATATPPPDTYTFVVSLSYPFWDMLLILAIVLLMLQRIERALRPSLIMLGLGILCTTWADTIYAYFTSLGTYTTGTPYIDPFWFIGSLLMGLSALYQYHSVAQRTYNQQTHPDRSASQTEHDGLSEKVAPTSHSLLRQALLSIPFVALLILLLYMELGGHFYPGLGGNPPITFVMALITAVVGVLIVIRYLLAAHENEILLREREQLRQQAERLRLANTELSNILDLEGVLQHIVFVAASDLGFDAAMLMLISEYDNPHEAPLHLMMRATAAPSLMVDAWQIEDDALASYAILAGKELEVAWENEQPSLPSSIADWHKNQHIGATYFAPLTFHEKIQGCIGFSSCAPGGLKQTALSIAKTYTGQVAAIIEHTRLYQTTLEQETFAKAIANIAARLNAALIEPDEVYQLICTAGADALQADYALLYGFDGEKLLRPLAAFVQDTEPRTPLEDWPPILPSDHEALALTFQKPALMEVDLSTLTGRRLFSFPAPAIRGLSRDTPTTIPAMKALARYPMSALRQKFQLRSVHRAILAPLISNERVLGLLILARSQAANSSEKKALGVGDLQHTQDLAEQVSVALTNALLYQRLQTTLQKLKELDHLKDQFMITASHELRTPLTSVQGYIELLAQFDESLPPEQRRDFLEKAQRSCDELVVLLANVMDASQLEIDPQMRLAHLEPVSVHEAVEHVINLIGPQLAQEQRVAHVDVPCDLKAQADEARLRQILTNLCVNALKYSPLPTPIAIAARALIVGNQPTIIISVKDWGNGIPPEAQSQLFERFTRLERDLNSPVRGSGLGLYISRRLVEAMHGRLWVESAGIPGNGSTFFIQLPVA